MQSNRYQQTARAAFSSEDWMRLMKEDFFSHTASRLESVDEVEDFILTSYDYLKLLQEQSESFASAERACGAGEPI